MLFGKYLGYFRALWSWTKAALTITISSYRYQYDYFCISYFAKFYDFNLTCWNCFHVTNIFNNLSNVSFNLHQEHKLILQFARAPILAIVSGSVTFPARCLLQPKDFRKAIMFPEKLSSNNPDKSGFFKGFPPEGLRRTGPRPDATCAHWHS